LRVSLKPPDRKGVAKMVKNIYEDFLRLAGFEEDEMSEYLPEWRKASAKVGLTEDDIKFATEHWIPTYFDTTLEGVRKSIGSFMKEFIDLTKASEYKEKGAKIVYGILPASLHYYYALKLTAPDKVFVAFPDVFLVSGLNAFFHKLNPYLEEAERSGISYGCRHCALNKTRYAARRCGLIPSPDISWIWGFICDEGPKTDEFIHLYHDPEWKTYITRIPHDQPLGTVEDEVAWRVEYLAGQMKDGFQAVQRELGIKVPDETITEVQKFWHRYATKIAELNQLIAADPQPVGAVSIRIFSEPLGAPFNTGVESMENALDITLKELRQRVDRKEGILPKGTPKLMSCVIPANLPWLVKMFEDNGVGLTYNQAFMPTKKQLQPLTYEDPYMATAEAWLRGGSCGNPGYEAAQICEKIETYKPDGMIFGFMDFDRWLGSDHRLLARMVEERTGLPVFYIEGDEWEDRDYSPEALRTRIESICEIIKMRKG
jgi:benzoyl-CoA reductase/2-hydroxyglutaryl-CoA dehydratase subunit BcrC/BadD/HgdB